MAQKYKKILFVSGKNSDICCNPREEREEREEREGREGREGRGREGWEGWEGREGRGRPRQGEALQCGSQLTSNV